MKRGNEIMDAWLERLRRIVERVTGADAMKKSVRPSRFLIGIGGAVIIWERLIIPPICSRPTGAVRRMLWKAWFSQTRYRLFERYHALRRFLRGGRREAWDLHPPNWSTAQEDADNDLCNSVSIHWQELRMTGMTPREADAEVKRIHALAAENQKQFWAKVHQDCGLAA